MKEKLLAFFLGRRLEDTELSEEKFNVLWGIPIFASDAISSVSYAGEEILLVLVPVLAMASFRVFLPIVAAIICLLTWGNLRGIRDSSVMFGVPTYLFILTMLSMIVTGIVKYSLGLVPPAEEAIMTANSAELATDAMVILVLKAFASGCTAPGSRCC